MEKVKKIKFDELHQGQFCKYRKQIYLIDADYCGVQLTGNKKGIIKGFCSELVTPIKVKIVEVKK